MRSFISVRTYKLIDVKTYECKNTIFFLPTNGMEHKYYNLIIT